jgi:hypothetical protein
MPDKRKHRGQNPADKELFTPENVQKLRLAVTDFSLLLTHGYAPKSALKLVGDRFNLTARQRIPLMRCSCTDQQLAVRTDKKLSLTSASKAQTPLLIDGFNLLITIEAALSNAPLFISRDSTIKDIASVHGTYRKVDETTKALELIADFLTENNLKKANWLLDSPVSNSGRLKKIIEALAQKRNLPWQIELLQNPDKKLSASNMLVVTADSTILDNCHHWLNLTKKIIKSKIPHPWLINLADSTLQL